MTDKLPAFAPVPGSRLNKKQAQALGLTMARLRQEGRLTPQEMVNEARPESAPTHPLYEWDDDLAAEQYRITQARHHMRSVIVTIKGADGMKASTRYCYVIEGRSLPYVTVRELAKDAALAQEIADQMYADAADLLAAYTRYCRTFATELRPFRRVATAIRALPKKRKAA